MITDFCHNNEADWNLVYDAQSFTHLTESIDFQKQYPDNSERVLIKSEQFRFKNKKPLIEIGWVFILLGT